MTLANNLDPGQAQKKRWAVWIQTAWHSIVFWERWFYKNNNKQTHFEKKSADDKTMTNYLVGKKSQWTEMEGASCTCMFHG